MTIGDIVTTGNTIITDSDGRTANMYKIPELTGIAKDDKVDVIGVCSQFEASGKGGYQIRVVAAADIVKTTVAPEVDTKGPEITVVSPASLATTDVRQSIKISYTDPSGVNMDSLAITFGGTDVKEKCEITDKYITYNPTEDLTLGKHKLSITLNDKLGNVGNLEAEIEVKEKINADGLNIYFGQLHSHSNISDGAGSIEDAYKYAKEQAGVDFLAVTDHSNSLENDTKASMADGSVSPEWVTAKDTAKRYSDSNFLGVYAYEMTWSNGTGHMNTFNTPGFESRNKDGLKNSDAKALENYYNILKEYPASISQWNHPGKTFGDFKDFANYDPQIDNVINLIEVGNGEGQVHGSGYFPSYEFYTRALDKGWNVSPTNNQDNHKGKWGNANTARTVVLADNLTEEGLYDALRNMRTYATEDENLSIVYTLNDEVMGSMLSDKPSEVKIKVDVKDEDAENIGKVSVIVNGGAVADSKVINANEGTAEFTLPADYSYYYIRVEQPDKDTAVTAPVWVGAVEKAGISKSETSTTMPLKGEELTISSSIYNNEDYTMNVKSIEYSIDGKVINNSSDSFEVSSLGTKQYSFKYTPDKAGSFNVNVKMIAEINGVQKTYTGVVKLTVTDPSIISRVVVDATHFNDYVAGYYANSMNNFTKIANAENFDVRIEKNKITDEILKDAQLLIISAPAKKAGNVNNVPYQPQTFSDEFISTVKKYTDKGGTVIVTGLADYQDGIGEYASSIQVNKLLEAIGATTRINNDQVQDATNNAGQSYRLKFKNINMGSSYLNGVVAAQEYSFYSGCSVALDKTAVEAGKADWLVKGHDTTGSVDSNKNTTGVSVPKGEVVALANEKLASGANVFVAGTVFMSDFEVQASLDNYGDLQYSNYNIIMNVLDSVKKEVEVTPISEVRKSAMGTVFCVEGYVTAGTKEGNSFFDTIYVQDETAGINIFPVAGVDLQVGQKVRIIGSVSEYEGEKQINQSSLTALDEVKVMAPTAMTTKSASLEENKGLLVSVTGAVKSIGKNNSGYMIVNDGSGDVRVFLNGYVGSSDGSLEIGKFDSNISVGDTVTAIGLASTDPEGPRIRVRDSKEVTLVQAKEVEITILHTNDSHGRVKADKSIIGIDTISAIKKSMPNSLLVDAGDTLHGLPFATLNKGADIVNLMKLAGYDLMAPGNHDFNYGYERLLELATLAVESDNGFNIISANVLKDNKPILLPNEIKEIDGVKVGFFGLTSPETTYKTNPNNVKGLDFADSIVTAKQQVADLKAQGAEVVIALAHIGTDEATEVRSDMIADEVEGIDVIIDGHSHSTYPNGYTTKNGTLIVSTGQYEGNLGRVSLIVDSKTKEIKVKTASLISKEQALTYTPDSVVTDAIKAIDKEQSVGLSEVVGNNLTLLNGVREDVRSKETNLGNLIQDSMLFETGADIAISNGGNIRANIDLGEITKGEIITVLPFGNYIVTKYLTGAQVKEVLEFAVSKAPAVNPAFAHVAGIKFSYDESKPAGQRIIEITMDGKRLDMEKKYLVATNDFLAVGGDNYPSFKEIPTENEFGAMEEALADYIKHLGDVNYKVEGRITKDTFENVANKEAAAAVTALINGLQEILTLADKALVVAARTAYDGLTEIQKALVSEAVVNKLVKAEETIKALEADKAAADVVIEKINSLPEKVTLADKGLVVAARTAYDGLTEAQKALVSETSFGKLVKAEVTIKALETNKEEAEVVIDEITNLPEKLTLADKNLVMAARTAYNSLTAEQKALVPEEVVRQLVEAENEIKKLEEAENNQKAADAVIEVINKLPAKLTLKDKELVVKARKAYEALTDAQKELVSKKLVEKLEKAEKDMKKLEEAANKPTKPGLPQTGASPVKPLYFGAAILLIGLGALVFKKRNNTDKKAQ
ncbi:MAG: 5'-nucleotidase C-terminal domain-containing protein [Clostridium sp.]